MVIAGVVGAVVALVAAYAATYHVIVTRDNRCDNVWQTIDAQLARRNDIISNLVETVRSCDRRETQALEDVLQVSDARAAVADATAPQSKMAASAELSDALSRFMASAETCPELMSSTSFQRLQADLTDAEHDICLASTSFNDCVLAYNNSISTFPGNIVAGDRFRRRQCLEVAGVSMHDDPKVEF